MLSGVGGYIKGYLHDLEIFIADKKILCPVIFSYQYSVSFNLLGRKGFFDKFQIIFEESQRQVQLNSILNIATKSKK